MRLFALIVILTQLTAFSASAQKRVSAKAEKQYKEAISLINDNRFDEAQKILTKVFNKNPHYARAGVTLGDIYIQQQKTAQAREVYEMVVRTNPDFSYRPHFQLGRMCLLEADYRQGKMYFEQVMRFKPLPASTQQDAGLYLNQCNFAIEALNQPVPFTPINLGDSINSEHDEYLPALTADDETIIFTRKDEAGEDFYVSSKTTDGSWAKAQALPPPLRTSLNEGAHCLTADGKTIYFTACYRNDSRGGCDLYMSQLTPEGWSVPVNLGDQINTKHWETQPSLSYDGQTLYFVSNRPGGFGGSDIWMSKRLASGEWGLPENMGPYINSRKDEISPFIHYDDQTLYFASEGMAGMGKLDIYLSRRMHDGEFGPARNLGYPINTEKDESSLFVNMAGNLALFSSESGDTRGGNDIYFFEMPEELRPAKAIYVKGKVSDIKSKSPLNSLVEVVDLANGQIVFKTETFKRDGAFLVSLPTGKSFAFNVSREGYLFYSENFSLTADRSTSEIYKIELQPIETGSEVILKNIFYAVNSFNLEEKSLIELRKLQEFLKLNPDVVIEIQGHTDNVGSAKYNLDLSQQRAKMVYETLIRFGADAKQLQFKGYGDAQPITNNQTEAGRSTNRRTQFKVLKVK
jgi:outer membrane protein OmpA-like peptidoglycan-associated protein